MINLKHLRYFWTVAKKGSIVQASKDLHITPQTISGQINLLEEQLGVALFNKVGRNLEVTDIGRTVINYADEIFALCGELEQSVRTAATDRSQILRIGVADAVPKSIAYRLLAPAMASDKPIRFVCKESSLQNLLGELALHKLDLIIADGAIPQHLGVRGYSHPLGECGVSFMAASQLAEQLVGEFPKCLNGAPILIPSSLSQVQIELLQWLDKHHLHPRIAGEFDDSALMKAFGQSGAGVFLVPSAIAEEVASQYEVRVVGTSDEIRNQFFAISSDRRLSNPALIAINNTARDWLN